MSAFSVLILWVGAVCNLCRTKRETANRGGGLAHSGIGTLSAGHAHSIAAAWGLWCSERRTHARPGEEPSLYRLGPGMFFFLGFRFRFGNYLLGWIWARFPEVCSDCRAERGLGTLFSNRHGFLRELQAEPGFREAVGQLLPHGERWCGER